MPLLVPLLDKESIITEEHIICIGAHRIPLPVIKTTIEIIFIAAILMYGLELGRTASSDYVKIAAWMCQSGVQMESGQIQKCYPSQEGKTIIWNCTEYQKQNANIIGG